MRPFFSVTTLKMHQLMVAMHNNLNKNNNFRMFEQTLLTVWRQYTKSKFNRRFPLKLQINFVFCLLWSGVTRFLYSYRQTDSIQSFYKKKPISTGLQQSLTLQLTPAKLFVQLVSFFFIQNIVYFFLFVFLFTCFVVVFSMFNRLIFFRFILRLSVSPGSITFDI